MQDNNNGWQKTEHIGETYVTEIIKSTKTTLYLL